MRLNSATKSTWKGLVGLLAGKNFGEKIGDKANILGGVILIAIGIEIFVTGIR